MAGRWFQVVVAFSLAVPSVGFSWTIMDESRAIERKVENFSEKLDGYLENALKGDFSHRGYSEFYDEYLEMMNLRLTLGSSHTYQLPDEVMQEYRRTGTGHVRAYSTLSSKRAPRNKKELCENVNVKFSVNQLLANRDNRMGFVNEGGLFGKGTCWWHSSLTRAAAYLTYYEPQAQKPSEREVKEIIEKLSQMNQVVRIPGYQNWSHFSSFNQRLIQDKLDSWQKNEALNFGWVRGVQGSHSDNATDMRQQLDALYNEVRLHGRPVYQMLQMSGYVAHAWVVLDVEKTTKGYDLYVTDSNFESIDKWSYTYGAPHFYYITTTIETFVPYTNSKEKGQQAMLQNAARSFCKRNGYP